MSTRFFWLKTHGNTVQELMPDEFHGKFQKVWNKRHVVYVHPNGDFYTNRNLVSGRHLKQILNLCEEAFRE